jgi:hypothetical protein
MLQTSREHWLVFWILALAVVVRAIAASRTDPVAFDSALYFEMSEFIRTGAWDNVLSYPYPPLFPLLIAGLEKLGIATEAAGLFWSFGLNLAVLVPLYFVARDVAGSRAALAAIFLWAIHPYAVRLSVRALSDAPTIFAVALALWIGLLGLRRKSLSLGLLAGILSGLAYLTRPEGIEAALGLAVLYAWVAEPPVSSSKNLRQRIFFKLAWLSAPLIGWTLVASPYIAAISAQAGSLTLSKKKSIQSMLVSVAEPRPGEDQIILPSKESSAGLAPPQTESPGPSPVGQAQAPPNTWWRIARSIYIFQQPLHNGVYPVVLALAAWGAIAMQSGRISIQRPALMLLIGLIGLHFLVLLGVAADQGAEYLGGHHFFLLVLYLSPIAGAGLAVATEQIRERYPQVRWAPAGLVAVISIMILGASIKHRDHRGEVLREAGNWVHARLPDKGVVVTNDAKFAFHAGAQRVGLHGNYHDAIAQARKRGASFVGLSADSGRAAELQALVQAGVLDLAVEFSERSGKRFSTYQVYRIVTPRGQSATP